MRYTKEILEKHVAISYSMADVMRKIGLKITGGSHGHLKSRIKKFDIDTSHFTGQACQKGKPSKNKKCWQEVLVDSCLDRRMNALRLRRALIESGIKYECVTCGCQGKWRNGILTLQVDHIDGNFTNNQRDNLRFLCPNCHAITPNWGKIKSGSVIDPSRKCIDCGKKNSKKSDRCKSCAMKARQPTKINWPATCDLQEMLESSSFSAVARKLGVSDNAVRKRLRNHV